MRDQALQAVDLLGQVDGARAFRLHVLFDRALLALPLFDQRGEPDLVVLQLVAVDAPARSRSVAMVLRSAHQFAEIGGEFFRAPAQFGHHGSEQHRGAQRLQRVFRPHQQRRRRAPAGALQCRQHLDDFGAARIERAADLLLAAVERAQPRFGVADPGLDAAHLGGDVDQLLVELAAVLSDRGDIGLQLLPAVRRRFFCCARAASSSCSRCLMASGEAAVACCVGAAATWAAAGEMRCAAKPADNKAMRKRNADRTALTAAGGVGVRVNVPR